VVATLVLGIVIAVLPGEAAVAVDIWLLAVGTFGLLFALGRTLGGLPRERPTRLDAAPTARPHQTRPRELTKLEREVGLSTETAFDTYYRLRPTVRRVAAAQLRLRGADLDAPGGAARSLLGPEAWNLVRADLARPRAHDAAGLTLDRIAEIVDAVEAL
jgi:hypothetical protein